jgi:DNA-binding transcriptional regulator YiaG
MKKIKTYMNKLMENKEFREKFDKEYQYLCIGEHIARIRHRVKLTQDALAEQRKNNKAF